MLFALRHGVWLAAINASLHVTDMGRLVAVTAFSLMMLTGLAFVVEKFPRTPEFRPDY